MCFCIAKNTIMVYNIFEVRNLNKCISQYESNSLIFNHTVCTNPVEKKFELHTHDICELLFLKKGKVSAIVGAKEYKLQKDCLVIFRENIPHKIQIEENVDYERYDIIFDEKIYANEIFKKIPTNIDIINFSGNGYINELLLKLDFYCEFFKDKDLKILCENIVEELLYNIYLTPKSEYDNTMLVSHPIIVKATEYINEHFAKPITIDDVCKYTCVTKSYLHQLFKKYLNTTPKKYINTKRLFKAQNLIKIGEKPGEIYSACGFSEYVTFFRNYVSYFGYTPSEKEKIIIERKIES